MRRREVLAVTGLSAISGCLRLTSTGSTGTETADSGASTGATTGNSRSDPVSVNSVWLWRKQPADTTFSDNALYVGRSDEVIALNPDSGNEMWSETTDFPVHSVAATDEGVIVSGGVYGDQETEGSGTVAKLRSDSGVESRIDVAIPVGLLSVTNQTVFVGSSGTAADRKGPTLFALARSSLDKQWTASQFATDGVSGVSVAEGTALVGYHNHFATYSLDDGSYGMSTDWGVSGSPLVIDGVAYITTHGGLRALDIASGIEQWTFENENLQTAPTLVNGTLYVGGWDGLYAVEDDGSNGRKVLDTGGEEIYITTPPVFHAGYVWVLTVDERLIAVGPTHEQVLFETQLDGRGVWLAGSSGRLYVGHDAGVEAFTVETP